MFGLVLTVIFITLFFLLLIECARRVSGLPRNVYNYQKDITSTIKKSKISKDKKKFVFLGKHNKKTITMPLKFNHIFVCGTTGSGKTVALSNFIKASIEYKLPMLIIDGKGDVGTDSILDILTKIKGERKLYVINLNDPQKSDKYNPFYNTSITVIKDMLLNLSDWSEEHYKYNFARYLQCVISILNVAQIPLSLKNIVKYLNLDTFINLSALLAKEKKLRKEEHLINLQIANNSGKIAAGAIARFATLVEGDLGTIFSESGIDIITALEQKAIILFILNPLLYPEASKLFGKLVIIDSKKAVSKLYDSSNKKRSFFLFDEINVYASKTLLDLVNKSRSAKVSCILAAQSLSDLESAENAAFKEQVIENCNNYLLLRQNSSKNAEEWANIVGTQDSFDITYQLKKEYGISSDTGAGSLRKTKEYIIHPDTIKNLQIGKGFFVSKDNQLKVDITINKPF